MLTQAVEPVVAAALDQLSTQDLATVQKQLQAAVAAAQPAVDRMSSRAGSLLNAAISAAAAQVRATKMFQVYLLQKCSRCACYIICSMCY
jgi:hypothetical protein